MYIYLCVCVREPMMKREITIIVKSYKIHVSLVYFLFLSLLNPTGEVKHENVAHVLPSSKKHMTY